ncbi:unnamed protein product [Parajaminaea phylloscopi]
MASSSAVAPLQTPRRATAAHGHSLKTPHRTPGEQTSQTPIVNFDTIEYQKENVQPSSRGRSAHSLSQTLSLKHKERAEELLCKRKEFEAKVTDEALGDSDDPLSLWEEYVDWVIESFPSAGTSADSGLIPLLERATRSLKDDERYRDSYRYLRLWLLYSRNVESQDLVINWLLANEVGTGCAALYEEGATVAEAKGLYESADALFKLGIGRSATPLARLKRRYAEYQARILRNQSASGSSDVNGASEMTYSQALAKAMKESKRVTLGTKDERTGRSAHANTIRGAGRSAGLGGASSNALANNGRKLAVFRDVDGNADKSDGAASGFELGTRDVRRQENTKEAKAWLGERLLQRKVPGSAALAARGPGKAPLKVFHDSDEDSEEDDEGQASPSKRNALSRKPTLGSQHPEVDLLKRDPFHLWSAEVQSAAEALRGVELGTVVRPAPGQRSQRESTKDDRSSSTRPSSARPGSSTSSNASRSTSRATQSSTAATSARRGVSSSTSSSQRQKSSTTSKAPKVQPPATKRPERLAVPEALLYPDLDAGSSGTAATSAAGAKECSIDEILARQHGWRLNLSDNRDEEEDPWSYLDVKAVCPTQLSSKNEDEPEDMEVDECQEHPSVPQNPRPPVQKEPAVHDVASRPAEPEVEPSIRPPSPTMMTKAAEEEVFALFNGADEDSEDGSESSEEEEEDVPSRAAPTASYSADRREESADAPYDSNMPQASASPVARGPDRASPLPSKPLDFTAPSCEEPSIGETSESRARSGAQRVNSSAAADEEEDEESEPDEEAPDTDAHDRRYNFEVGQDLLEGGARYDQLTTISERTEYETRWAMATPARTRTLTLEASLPEEDEDEGESLRLAERAGCEGQISIERSVASESHGTPRSTSLTSRTGGKAAFQLSPGYTIEKADHTEAGCWTAHSNDPAGQSSSSPRPTSHSIDEFAEAHQLMPNPCSPTDPDVIAHILKNLALPIQSSPDFFDLSSVSSDKLTKLQRYFKTSSDRMNSQSEPLDLDVDGITFAVREKLGEGAYGSVFLAEDVDNRAPTRTGKIAIGGLLGDSSFDPAHGSADEDEQMEDEDEDEAERRRMVAIKIETPANHWEFYILGQMRARLEERDLQSIIGARRFYAFRDESLLLLEWGEKGTLLEIVNQAGKAGVAPPGSVGAGIEEVLAMFFTIELLRVVDGLHRAQLLHGDLKIDNCLLRLDECPSTQAWSNTYRPDGSEGWSSKGLYLVDFGRAIDLSAFPPLQKFVADWETDGRDCVEMREARPWTYEVDYHGIASIAFCLLFGKYIETVDEIQTDGRRKQKIAAPLKRYWQTELWGKLFDTCLNPRSVRPDSQLPIAFELAVLRGEMEQWLSENSHKGGKHLKGLLKKAEIWTMSQRV